MQQTINQEMQGECFAKFIRFGEIFTLVTYHLSKSYTRVEGLKIKNQYRMKENGMGYEGVVPKSLFNGGSMVV